MIEISNELFTYLVNALEQYDQNIGTSSVYENVPSKYPFVSFVEIDNSVYENGMDNGNIENFANVEYDVNVYTKSNNKKSSADAIVRVIDTLMTSKGFVRRSKVPLQNVNDDTYQVALIYGAVVSKDKIVYRR